MRWIRTDKALNRLGAASVLQLNSDSPATLELIVRRWVPLLCAIRKVASEKELLVFSKSLWRDAKIVDNAAIVQTKDFQRFVAHHTLLGAEDYIVVVRRNFTVELTHESTAIVKGPPASIFAFLAAMAKTRRGENPRPSCVVSSGRNVP